MELTEFIGFYQTQVGLVDKIWWYFYSVTIAVISFILVSENIIKKKHEVTIITVGYMAFSFGSAISLWNGQRELRFFAEMVDSSGALRPFSPLAVITFQGAIAIAAVATIIAMYVYRRKVQ